MILDTLWKLLFSKKQFGFLTTLADPPPRVWQKTILFPNFFFLNPSLSTLSVSLRKWKTEEEKSSIKVLSSCAAAEDLVDGGGISPWDIYRQFIPDVGLKPLTPWRGSARWLWRRRPTFSTSEPVRPVKPGVASGFAKFLSLIPCLARFPYSFQYLC